MHTGHIKQCLLLHHYRLVGVLCYCHWISEQRISTNWEDSGGLQGRPLKAGDLLPLTPAADKPQADKKIPASWIPAYPAEGGPWEIGVLPGPNAAPDYFTDEDIQTLYSATYTVHYNS